MINLISTNRSAFLVVLLMMGVLFQGCSSYDTARIKRMNFSDDLYSVADAEQINRSLEANSTGDPYRDYSDDGQRNRRSSRSNRLNRYDRDLEWAGRFGNPLWSNPGWDYGMGGFYGCRSYMLYNPFLPPYWGMNPGFSMGWGSPYGMYGSFGYNPWMYGGAWGAYDPWGWNSWNSPWCNNWGMNSYWGWNNGWNNGWNCWNPGGSGLWVSSAPALKPSPGRSNLPGSSLPGFIQRGKTRAPARQPNALAGGGFSGRMSGIGSQYLSARSAPSSSSEYSAGSRSGQSRSVSGSQSSGRTPAGGSVVSRRLRSTEASSTAEVRYPYASPGTGFPDNEIETPSRSGTGSTGSTGSYTPRSYTPSRSGTGSTGSTGSYTPRSTAPSTPSRSYTPSSPSRSGSSGNSRPSSPPAVSRPSSTVRPR